MFMTPTIVCPSPAISLTLRHYYIDDTGSQIDHNLRDELHRAVTPCKTFVEQLGAFADAGDASNYTEWALCWARAGAYLGDFSTLQSKYQRKWDLCGISISFFKIADRLESEARAEILFWIEQIATQVIAFIEGEGSTHKRNNHLYWTGLGIGALSLSNKSEQHFTTARNVLVEACAEVTEQGFLPLELARGSMALHYHCFSCMALLPLACIGWARQEDWFKFNDEALHRLLRITILGITHPGVFKQATGIAQNTNHLGTTFIPLYESIFKERIAPWSIDSRHHWLGGEVGNFHQALINLRDRSTE
jgi:poly(beta-D-mannuronate) lyase